MKVDRFEKKRFKNYDFIHNKKIISQKEADLLSSAYCLLKICLLLLAAVSFIKIGHLSTVRLSRLKEIKISYIYEKNRFKNLTNRLDKLLFFDGEQRFMKDQDQMISRDVLRVIWR